MQICRFVGCGMSFCRFWFPQVHFHNSHPTSETNRRWTTISQRSTVQKLCLLGFGIVEIATPRFCIPHPTSCGEEFTEGDLWKPKSAKRHSASRILQTCNFAQRRISKRKLNFSTEFLDRSDHSGHYRFGQSTLQLSSKCIDGKTYIDAYTRNYSKEQCINST